MGHAIRRLFHAVGQGVWSDKTADMVLRADIVQCGFHAQHKHPQAFDHRFGDRMVQQQKHLFALGIGVENRIQPTFGRAVAAQSHVVVTQMCNVLRELRVQKRFRIYAADANQRVFAIQIQV